MKTSQLKIGFVLWLVAVAVFTATLMPPAVHADCSDGSANY